MAAGKTENTRGVEQTEKKVPRITGEVASGQPVSQLVYGVNIFELDFRAQVILSNDQSSATLCVREKCLIIRLRPFMIILVTASVSSKM